MKKLLTLAALSLLVACSAESKPADMMPEAAVNIAAELPALSGDHLWDVVRSESRMTFKAVHSGREFEGSFGNFDAAIKLDPDNPELGEIHAVIDMTNFDAGDSDRNANLPRPEWFDNANHPLATFVSEDIRRLENQNYEAQGVLSIKGVSQPITLNFSLDIEGNAATATGAVTFSRKDFNVGTGSDFETEDWVKFPVDVSIKIKAARGANPK